MNLVLVNESLVPTAMKVMREWAAMYFLPAKHCILYVGEVQDSFVSIVVRFLTITPDTHTTWIAHNVDSGITDNVEGGVGEYLFEVLGGDDAIDEIRRESQKQCLGSFRPVGRNTPGVLARKALTHFPGWSDDKVKFYGSIPTPTKFWAATAVTIYNGVFIGPNKHPDYQAAAIAAKKLINKIKETSDGRGNSL
jgi:hypothetical protein